VVSHSRVANPCFKEECILCEREEIIIGYGKKEEDNTRTMRVGVIANGEGKGIRNKERCS
jgi:hypothetical protein